MSIIEREVCMVATALRTESLGGGIHFETGEETAVLIRVHQDDNV
jgi:hypothetical protein